MPISEKNTKFLIIMPKELKADIEAKAKEENRTISNWIVTKLKEAVERE